MTFEPQNPLEHSLVLASSDPAWRPQFYRDFADSQILVITRGAEGPALLQQGGPLVTETWETAGKKFVPIFSSLPRLEAVAPTGTAYAIVNTFDFLEMMEGRDLVLNPGSPYSKEFTAGEVADFVDGSMWALQAPVTIDRPTPIEIGQPAEYPRELVDVLVRLFARSDEVQRAWIALVRFRDRNDVPHTMLFVEVNESYFDVLADIGIIAQSVPVANPPLEVMPFTRNRSLSGYVSGIKPFYERK